MREPKPFRESLHLSAVQKSDKLSLIKTVYLRRSMSTDLESLASEQQGNAPKSHGVVFVPKSWLKVGAVAAASAVLGGLAAAWFYRKTLSQLREAEEKTPDSEIRATEYDSPEDF